MYLIVWKVRANANLPACCSTDIIGLAGRHETHHNWTITVVGGVCSDDNLFIIIIIYYSNSVCRRAVWSDTKLYGWYIIIYSDYRCGTSDSIMSSGWGAHTLVYWFFLLFHLELEHGGWVLGMDLGRTTLGLGDGNGDRVMDMDGLHRWISVMGHDCLLCWACRFIPWSLVSPMNRSLYLIMEMTMILTLISMSRIMVQAVEVSFWRLQPLDLNLLHFMT